MTKTALSSQQLSDIVIKGLQEKKGVEIVVLDLRKTEAAITDFFVICTGGSDRQVEALAESVVHFMSDAGERALSKEGLTGCEWVLLDYANVVVHIFQASTREFYRLESLWGDALIRAIPDEEGFEN